MRDAEHAEALAGRPEYEQGVGATRYRQPKASVVRALEVTLAANIRQEETETDYTKARCGKFSVTFADQECFHLAKLKTKVHRKCLVRAVLHPYSPPILNAERCVKPNAENLTVVLTGEDYVAKCDFLGQHISVLCRYDTNRRCWSSKAFRVDDAGQHRLFIPPHEMYSSTKLGSIQCGLRMAKYAIMRIERSVHVAAPESRSQDSSSEETRIAPGKLLPSVTWIERMTRTWRMLWRCRPMLLGDAWRQ